MAAAETFANLASTAVVSGGTTAPAGGTTETWTVASSASFPSVSTGVTQVHVADISANSEIILVTNISGTTWSVTRGAESTTPVAHTAGFTVCQVATAGFLNGITSGGGGSGTVTSVTATDTSIVVSGTVTVAPTIATGTLDVVATQHPPAGNWSNNSHKITSLANGAGAQDAAAFGQIPVTGVSATSILPANAATLGSTGTWADLAHVHPWASAEPLTSGEALYYRAAFAQQQPLVASTLMLSYWTAVKTETINKVKTITGGTAAPGNLTYANIGIFTVDVSGNLTLVASTGDLHSTLWIATFTEYNTATALLPGDSVLFQGGQSFTGLLHLTHSGAAQNPVTIATYGTGTATITNGANNALWLDSAGGYAFQGINFTATTGSSAYTGANCFADGTGQLPAITFAGCSFSGGWQQGLTIGGSGAADGWNGITITGCDASGNLYGGISIFGVAYNPSAPAFNHQNVLVAGTTATGNTGDASVTTQGTGWGIDVASVNGGTVTGCTAHGNGAANGDTSSGPVGIWVSASTNVTVTRCLSYNNHSGTSVDGDGFDLDEDCTNCTIEYCIAYGNDGAGILLFGGFTDNAWSGNTARYNVTWGNGQVNSSYGEITLGGQIAGAAVYGNTCVSRDGASTFPSPLLLQYGPGMTGCTIRNNIFYGGGFGDLVFVSTAPATSGALMQGNLYFSPNTTTIHWGTDYAGLAAFRAGAPGQEKVGSTTVGLQADPKLVNPSSAPTVTNPLILSGANGLKLKQGSPCKGAGLSLSSLFGVGPGVRDFFGTALTSPLPIGAAAARVSPRTALPSQVTTL